MVDFFQKNKLPLLWEEIHVLQLNFILQMETVITFWLHSLQQEQILKSFLPI